MEWRSRLAAGITLAACEELLQEAGPGERRFVWSVSEAIRRNPGRYPTESQAWWVAKLYTSRYGRGVKPIGYRDDD